ncbi:MAG: 50S ribosomal protein L21 [Firmicutes bacterium]|nr:50S ribosomal protein L21 [Bacillota bacterium]
MYAIVLSGGKQYKAAAGDVLEVEKLSGKVEGGLVALEVLMTVDGEKVLTGSEVKAKVNAEIVSHNKGKKITVYKYKPKKNVRTKKGHRQLFTRIKILPFS